MDIKNVSEIKSKLRIGLSGVSGSGKTMSALLLARGLCGDWNKIIVIDTENASSALYAGLGGFKILKLSQPFSPNNYIKAINECERLGAEVIIIDSITHEWKGVGGCLDIHSKLGGRFQDWSKVTPFHQKFIDAIHASNCQIITTVRRKQQFLIEANSNGKLEVKKLGTKEETRNGFEYELSLNFELSGLDNKVQITKDRTGIFRDTKPFMITESTGRKLKEWLTRLNSAN
ncbi:AAA family ATPase [Croceivirga radicis]|uniref:AAA family ATPase n=1 Tax=Croceivirga radicis TaxID=1929488 RepID=UPI000255AED1|nr:AAA family ATPase [Croceivirga radicis]